MATDKNWIQKAIKNPGALRKKAGVKAGKKISGKELTKLSKSKNPTTRKQANLAKTLKKMKIGGIIKKGSHRMTDGTIMKDSAHKARSKRSK